MHEAGGKIFNQIWHVGRVSHPIFQQGNAPIAPSAIAPVDTKVWIVDEAHPEGQMVDCPEPRAMVQADIDRVVADFAQAGVNAVAAGFDGIEIHGGNGYLIDQFYAPIQTTEPMSTAVLRKIAFVFTRNCPSRECENWCQ